MSRRFFFPALGELAGRPSNAGDDRSRTLDGTEGHHLAHVLRAAPGDLVQLFDGAGRECEAEVCQVKRSAVLLRIGEVLEVDRELPFELTLAVALPKGDYQVHLVQKAVELGVTRLVPLVTERGVVQPSAATARRLERTVIEACKQCGRNRLMEVAPAEPWPQAAASKCGGEVSLVAHPPGEAGWLGPAGGASQFGADLAGAGRIAVAVGAEGGWTDAELELAERGGWNRVGLGPRTLRVETAAVLLVALVVASRRDGSIG
jgi:16S rRNA (uracil1498-N3)-methyltransferase